MNKPTKKNEIALVKKIEPIAIMAQNLVIKTQEDMKTAVEILSKLNQYNDQIKNEKEKITKPLNEALRAERGRWKPLETMYDNAIVALRTHMSEFQTEAERIRKEGEQKIVSRIAPGKGNISLETGIKKIEELDKVEKEVATTIGLVQFREKKVLKILDRNLIPVDYLVVDEDRVFADLKAGLVVPGATLETVQIPVNYR